MCFIFFLLGIHCPSGMQYQVCGNSCTRSCDDLTRYKQCSKTSECVEGCFCPTGRTMDSHGECVPIATCSCMQNGMEYPAGHKEIRPGSKALQLWYELVLLHKERMSTFLKFHFGIPHAWPT